MAGAHAVLLRRRVAGSALREVTATCALRPLPCVRASNITRDEPLLFRAAQRVFTGTVPARSGEMFCMFVRSVAVTAAPHA